MYIYIKQADKRRSMVERKISAKVDGKKKKNIISFSFGGISRKKKYYEKKTSHGVL
jgi:hypothetical protein